MAERVCPVWAGYLLASPLRKLFENPNKILSPYVRDGMNVLDIGCAMGFFSLPLARMVGSKGKVICVDMQAGMIKSLEKRAKRAKLSDRIDTRFCLQNSLGLDDLAAEIDFGFAFAVVHEAPDAAALFSEIYEAIKPSGKLLVAEPGGHVSEEKFKVSVSIAEERGFKVIDKPQISRNRVILLEK